MDELIAMAEPFMFDIYVVLGMSVYFGLGCLVFPDEKRKAWLITGLQSLLCTVAGFKIVYDLEGVLYMREEVIGKMEHPFSVAFVRFFLICNIMDLVCGVLFYKSELDPLTTWFHHFCYVLLCSWVLRKNYCVLFGIFLTEELPTFIMSLGRIEKSLRSDLGFGATYFVLRIVLHTYMVYTCFAFPSPEPWWKMFTWAFEETVFGPMKFNLILTITLHYYWFTCWILQQIRLARQTKVKGKEEKLVD